MRSGGEHAMSAGQWARAVADADLVVLGPAPPLRGGIAQHTLRLGESAIATGRRVAVVSFRRLYPAGLFPGRSQRTAATPPPWCREMLDVLSPASWLGVAPLLEKSRATVLLQWWHPVTAPAYGAAVRRVPRERLVALCHNVTPHEPLPGAAAAARLVLSRCGRIVCHGRAEAARVEAILGTGAPPVASVPLPCLVSDADLEAGAAVPELAALPADARLVVAAGHVRPYKATALLVRAWRRAERPAAARLVVAGESYLSAAERRAVTEAAAADPSILFVDRYVEDAELVQILRSAEVLVAAHLDASQSGLLPVAQALGVPCIVSDAGSLPEQAAAGAGHEVVTAGDEVGLRDALARRLAAPPVKPAVPDDGPAQRGASWRRVVDAVIEANGCASRPTARPGDSRDG